jgi:signal transduction histidine kinase
VASVALSHLLENAAQYSPAGRPVVIDASVTTEGLCVVVTDHGPGLHAAELGHLFERFYRGRAARQLAPGTGMGLAITRGLLAAVNGRVWAENAPDAGARFTMIVPGPKRAVPLLSA